MYWMYQSLMVLLVEKIVYSPSFLYDSWCPIKIVSEELLSSKHFSILAFRRVHGTKIETKELQATSFPEGILLSPRMICLENHRKPTTTLHGCGHFHPPLSDGCPCGGSTRFLRDISHQSTQMASSPQNSRGRACWIWKPGIKPNLVFGLNPRNLT